MNRRQLALAAAGVLAVGVLSMGTLAAVRAQTGGPGTGNCPGYPNGPGGPGMMGGQHGPGMMGGQYGQGVGTCPGYPGGGYGPGMMGGGYGPGMMGGGSFGQPAGSVPQSIDEAKQAVQQAAAAYGVPNPTVKEVLEFERNFYAIVANGDTGENAVEMLVDKGSGFVSLEFGPAMMWNTTYGHMAGYTGRGGYGHGMMGGVTAPSDQPTVTADRAEQIAQQWLDANQSGSTAEEPDSFPGYFTVHFQRDGQVAGMLSVNAYSGAVWYHTWHGAFIGEAGE